MTIEIYSTDTDSGQLSVIRHEGDSFEKVADIAVGNAPRGSVKFTADGRGFVSNTSTNTVSEIDGLSHEETTRITVGSGPRGLFVVPGDRYLLVSNSGSDTVSVVDLATRQELRQVPVGRDPRHMVVVGDAAYVCLWGEGSLAKLDISGLTTGDVDAVAHVATITLGPDTFPYSLNVDSVRMKAYVACNAIESVPVLDLATDTLTAHVPVRAGGIRAVAFTTDQQYALATLERDSSVAVIDLDTDQVTRYLEVGPGPRGITVDSTGVVYAAAFSRPTVARFDVPDYGAHSVTIVDVSETDLATEDAPGVKTTSVGVGFGPCSVSAFDPIAAQAVRAEQGIQLIEV